MHEARAIIAAAALLAMPAAAEARVIDKGDRGKAVKRLQRALGVTADGIFGPGTKKAVKRFQRRHGLAADGIVGPATAKALGLRVATESVRHLAATDPVLTRIAECESGGNPAAVSADGQYRGKYQFSRATWAALGGTGDPAKASEAEQDRLAAALYAQRGTSPWPNCA